MLPSAGTGMPPVLRSSRRPVLLPISVFLTLGAGVDCTTLHQRRAHLRSSRVESESEGQWQVCADEGEPVSAPGRVRFGWAMSWVESSLPPGATCSVASFGSDPAPFIRKVCQCSPQQQNSGTEVREEMGMSWAWCADEGKACSCPSGVVRFGEGNRWVTSAAEGQTAPETVLCRADGFDGEDPAVSVTKECWCKQSPPTPQAKQARVAVVLLSRRPPNLDLWLKYHLGYMGIEHVFIDVEDTPEFNTTWAGLRNTERQHVTLWKATPADRGFGSRPADDYETLQRRQLKAMRRAKEEAAERGIDWLLHIDDDELLYTPMHRKLGELLAAMPPNFDQAFIPNVEAVYPSADIQNCFADTTEINVNPYTYNSYANGKAAVRVSDDAAVPAGPHMWKEATGGEVPSIMLDREPFGSPLFVVHYESCPFARWEDKFWELGNTSLTKINSIPFRFYRESIKKMQSCRSASDAAANDDRQAAFLEEDCSTVALQHFWAQWKTEDNPALRRQDLVPLPIPWKDIAEGRFPK